MPWPTTTTFDVDRMPPRLSSGYCRNVASCEAPITVCSPSPQTTCEPFSAGECAARTCARSTQVEGSSGPVRCRPRLSVPERVARVDPDDPQQVGNLAVQTQPHLGHLGDAQAAECGARLI